MKLIRFLWDMSPRSILAAAGCGVVSGVCSTLLIVLIHHTLNHLDSVSQMIIIGFVALCVLNVVSAVISQVMLIKLSEGAVFELRMKLAQDILQTPLKHLEKVGTHRLLTLLTDDIRSLSSGLLCVPILGVQIIVMLGCLVYLGFLSVKLMAFVIVFMLIAVLTYDIPVRFALSRLKKARDKQDTLFKHFEALTQGTKELKLNRSRRQSFLFSVFQPSAELYRRHNIIGFSLYTCAANWGYLMFFAMMGLLLFYLPGVLALKPSDLVGASLIILFMRAPLETIFTLLPELGRSQVSLNQIEELGLTLSKAEEFKNEDAPSFKPKQVAIEFRDVTHRYHHEGEARDFTLGPLNLVFEPGELIFLVGGNGSGKTTLAKILLGLYEADTGLIFLDGQPVNADNLEEYRQCFSAVFSDFYLFDSLMSVDSEAMDIKAREYLFQLQLQHKVDIKDGEFSTIKLSQGQRKRLALLTAYLEDRPFYVFDEWAADQDPLFKEVFYSTLLPELKAQGKTIFCITHDDKYFSKADRIIKLDYGQIEFNGTPAEMNHTDDGAVAA